MPPLLGSTVGMAWPVSVQYRLGAEVVHVRPPVPGLEQHLLGGDEVGRAWIRSLIVPSGSSGRSR